MRYTVGMAKDEHHVDFMINPVYAVAIADKFFADLKPLTDKEDWVAFNVKAIDDLGADMWLNRMLDSLAGTGDEEPEMANPCYAVMPHRDLFRLQPAIERTVWIAANKKFISELGTSEWLWRLLDALEAGTLAAPHDAE